MGDLTKNLSRKEFECECGCGFDTVDFELASIIQEAVDYFTWAYSEDVYVIITGGNRCVEHNEKVLP